jgi:crotonobetainyl-CoA:carnitine CoA-transferase CaiB-like acyl-CoA transferase
VDGTGAALSGRTLLTGWPDRGPVIPSAAPYGDVIVPFAMAASIVAALQYRRRNGRGCHIDASMYELCVQQMRAAFVDGGTSASRLGNSDPGVFHQGVYATLGAERWLAVTFESSAQWQSFAATHHLQAREVAECNAVFAQWCAAREDFAAVEQLQELGIAAGVVQDMEDLFERDPLIRERHTLVPLVHPILGTFGHMRTPIDFSLSRPRPVRAPSIGEHNQQVCAALCGLSDTRFAALEQLGVFK